MKQRRLELGLTQEELCEGICEPITISRMENGRQTPSRNRINALLQRLGLPRPAGYRPWLGAVGPAGADHRTRRPRHPAVHSPLPSHPGEGRRTVQCGRAAANADEGPANDGASF